MAKVCRSLLRSTPALPLLALSLVTLPIRAQIPPAQSATTTLPDSPGYIVSSPPDPTSQIGPQPAPDPTTSTHSATTSTQAPLFRMTINPGETAQKLTTGQTVLLGLKDSVSTFSIAGWFATAGWSHLFNSTPNYGTDSAAFGQRLGASALRGATKGIFGNAVFAPLFRQDPRYYRMGAGPFHQRLRYAVSRVFVTRATDGHQTPNFSLFAGNLASSALTVTYYPPRNTSAAQVGKTYGLSFVGSLFGSLNREFLPDILVFAHLRKQE